MPVTPATAVADAVAVDGATDGELTAALQKAVVALGYDASLATRRDLVALFGRIAGGAPFPPRFLAFVRAETGVADSERVDHLLRSQVPGVRAAFAAAVQQEEAPLVELARLAEAEHAQEVAAEAARQAKLQSLRPCPAGFVWYREGGGGGAWEPPKALKSTRSARPSLCRLVPHTCATYGVADQVWGTEATARPGTRTAGLEL
ncbi:hypothetical protein BU14_0180s0008 [Porphyra umbilicalis]|uniref:Uncharacterized protein n=1 Tax=Porphyra umbilicalis TaxID=2786 RepID=A0A1X6P6Z2_PORUM|nr:hypothetical protein BU14_0180s0008 [Porphyra umbilicalis]|eukprot:OSX76661.1 hypothetical protein BU14_0180s0008 [Porphyra umbilicalis]